MRKSERERKGDGNGNGNGRTGECELNVSQAASKLNRNGRDNPASRALPYNAYHRSTATPRVAVNGII